VSPSPLGTGLQLERTALAWRRTVLALLVASLASVRVLFGTFGYAAIAIAAVGVALALLLRALAVRRISAAWDRLAAAGERAAWLPDGVPLALCTAVVVAVGLVALGYVFVH